MIDKTYILNILSERDVFDYRSSALSNAFLPTCKARRASSVKATRVAKRKAKGNDGKSKLLHKALAQSGSR